MRKIIFHYHLFKNAGSSLDQSFKDNFPSGNGQWVTKEFPANPVLNRRYVREWITNTPNAICFSSHTAYMPPPKLKGIDIFPVVFVREPLKRIVSAYNFEKNQNAQNFGSVLAKSTDLEGYIKCRLALKSDTQCKNFQAERFFHYLKDGWYKTNSRLELIVNDLPFVGVVEQFDESLILLETLLKEKGFNVSLKSYQLNKLNYAEIEQSSHEGSLLKDFCDIVLENNHLDSYLHEYALKILAAKIKGNPQKIEMCNRAIS